jgi:hypothetical protein
LEHEIKSLIAGCIALCCRGPLRAEQELVLCLQQAKERTASTEETGEEEGETNRTEAKKEDNRREGVTWNQGFVKTGTFINN